MLQELQIVIMKVGYQLNSLSHLLIRRVGRSGGAIIWGVSN
jgi:hypothetical protein